jgi:hypothetical protein
LINKQKKIKNESESENFQKLRKFFVFICLSTKMVKSKDLQNHLRMSPADTDELADNLKTIPLKRKLLCYELSNQTFFSGRADYTIDFFAKHVKQFDRWDVVNVTLMKNGKVRFGNIVYSPRDTNTYFGRFTCRSGIPGSKSVCGIALHLPVDANQSGSKSVRAIISKADHKCGQVSLLVITYIILFRCR